MQANYVLPLDKNIISWTNTRWGRTS